VCGCRVAGRGWGGGAVGGSVGRRGLSVVRVDPHCLASPQAVLAGARDWFYGVTYAKFPRRGAGSQV